MKHVLSMWKILCACIIDSAWILPSHKMRKSAFVSCARSPWQRFPRLPRGGARHTPQTTVHRLSKIKRINGIFIKIDSVTLALKHFP